MNLVIFMKEQQLDALLENINYEIKFIIQCKCLYQTSLSDIYLGLVFTAPR